MQPQMNPQQVHVVNVAPPLAGQQIYAHTPVQVVCPFCNSQVVTVVNETPGTTAYLWSLVLFCLCCPLMFIPCFISSLLDKTHTCPRCHRVLGQVKA
jgi:lipopolysaccharide-induced tumor necrosis factor-alpha factor